MNTETLNMTNRIKILFFHFDLGNGGAEKVLVNLINSLDTTKYDITLRTIFTGSTNYENLRRDITYKPVFNFPAKRGTALLFKLLPPKLLYRTFIKKKYDIEIAYLEEIPTRIIGGGRRNDKTKKYAWIHNTVDKKEALVQNAFRSVKEFNTIYNNYDKLAFVSEGALKSFEHFYKINIPKEVVHNVSNFDLIRAKAKEDIDIVLSDSIVNLCSVGRLASQKGYKRLLKIMGSIYSNGINNWNLYLIGSGEELSDLQALSKQLGVDKKVYFLGYQENPYKYLSKMDIFVCSSYKEGFSTAVTESIALGIPVVSTDCSGMNEILSEDAGLIVNNSDSELEKGIVQVLQYTPNELNDFKMRAIQKSKSLSNKNSILEFEKFIGTQDV